MATPAFIIHDLEQATKVAQVAAETGGIAILQSARGAAAVLGPDVFLALFEEAERAFPEAELTGILDCADEAGTALKALRCGAMYISVNLSGAPLEKIKDIAARHGAKVTRFADDATDLLNITDPEQTIRQHLQDARLS